MLKSTDKSSTVGSIFNPNIQEGKADLHKLKGSLVSLGEFRPGLYSKIVSKRGRKEGRKEGKKGKRKGGREEMDSNTGSRLSQKETVISE